MGLIHIYCGDGKGKTTAAVGLTVRCAGRGGRVLFVQFLKNQFTGELTSLSLLTGVKIMRNKGNNKFTFQMNEKELQETKLIQEKLIEQAIKTCRHNELDMLVLDEAIVACDLNMINENKIIEFLKNKPKKLEVVLTGRNPSQQLINIADYVSEICKRKHPYDKGIPSRTGIEE